MTVLSAGEDVNPQECLHMAARSEIGTITWENVLVFCCKVEYLHTFPGTKFCRISCVHPSGHNLGSFQ